MVIVDITNLVKLYSLSVLKKYTWFLKYSLNTWSLSIWSSGKGVDTLYPIRGRLANGAFSWWLFKKNREKLVKTTHSFCHPSLFLNFRNKYPLIWTCNQNNYRTIKRQVFRKAHGRWSSELELWFSRRIHENQSIGDWRSFFVTLNPQKQCSWRARRKNRVVHLNLSEGGEIQHISSLRVQRQQYSDRSFQL